MQSSKVKITILFSLSILMCLAIFYFVFYQGSFIHSLAEKNISYLPSKDDLVNVPPASVPQELKEQRVIDTDNFGQCYDFLDETSSYQWDWFSSTYNSGLWRSLLSQGYTLNEVSEAVGYFGGSARATNFKLDILRESSTYYKTSQALNAEFRQHSQNLSQEQNDSVISDSTNTSFQIGVYVPVPQSKLAGFNQLSQNEQTALMLVHGPTIDDIAYFTQQPNYSDDDILHMLKFIVNPAENIGYPIGKSVSLIDFAAGAGRYTVLEHLLAIGLSPTNDAFLPSTLEHALFHLSKQKDARDINEAVKSVHLLIDMGGTARFSVEQENRIKIQMGINSVTFDSDIVQRLQQNHGLDLLTLDLKDTVTFDEDNPLTVHVDRLKQAAMSKKSGVSDFKQTYSECVDKTTTIYKTIRHLSTSRVSPHAIIDIVKQPSPNSKKTILKSLSRIDPLLVDLYNGVSKTHLSRPKEMPEAYRMQSRRFQTMTVRQILAFFAQQELSEAERNWLFFEFQGFNEDYELFVQYDLDVPDLSFSEIARLVDTPSSLEKLRKGDLKLFDFNNHGKALLFYVASHLNVEVLNYMEQERFAYALEGDVGEDPLHMALREGKKPDERHNLFETIEVLMRYKPPIDEFHLGRMAEIQLLYPQLYSKIVSRYPQLSAVNTTFLPRVCC